MQPLPLKRRDTVAAANLFPTQSGSTTVDSASRCAAAYAINAILLPATAEACLGAVCQIARTQICFEHAHSNMTKSYRP